MANRLLLSLFSFSLILSYPQNALSSLGMQTQELSSLFEVMGSLIADPAWVQLHPHPCTDTPWPGVQCEMIQSFGIQDPFLHVTRIHIGPDLLNPPCKPNAKLPPSLPGLPHLKALSLFNCFVTPFSNFSLSSALFTNVSALEQVVLNSNSGLFGEIPPGLAMVKSLRVLSLSQNNLRGEIPKEIGGLARLKQLDVSYNNLAGVIPEEIGWLASLTILDLSWNKLQGKIPWSVGELISLQKIDLSFNSLSETIPWEFGKLDQLVLLDLSHNSITGPMPETLANLNELQYFLMEHNPIKTRIPNFVGGLKKLAVVGFSSCGLLGPIPSCLGSLQNLTALALDKNELNGSVPSSLGALPRLGQLNLSQNQLSGEIGFAQDFVSRLGKRLDVRDNKGLCKNHQLLSVLSLEAPTCFNSSTTNNNSWSSDYGAKKGRPSLDSDDDDDDDDKISMGSSLSCVFSLGFGLFLVILNFACLI